MSTARIMDMTGRRALVVGASSGIGREVALRFAALGADVAFHGRRRDRLEEAVERSGGGYAIVADLCDPSQCDALVADAVAKLGGIDALVFAASASPLRLVKDTPAEEWARVFASNVIAPALVARATLQHLSPGGLSAFISSESVGAPYHGLIPYTASKAALEELVRGLRLEHPEHRFACFRVGNTMPTEFGRDFSPELAGELMPKWIALGRIPAQPMDAEELGRVIADSVAIALDAPSIELQDIVMRAPGGHFAGDAAAFVAGIDAQHQTVYGSDE